MLPENVMEIPSHFENHPFCCTDFTEQVCIQKQAVQRLAERMADARKQFYMDYGFM
jgi:hypothetical protein